MKLPTQVIEKFEISISDVEDLGSAGGFSGANLWKVLTDKGDGGHDGESLCIRRWPPETDRKHLDWIHLVLHHARIECPFVAAPMRTASGENFTLHDGYIFEVAPWMRGKADFADQPSDAKLTAAMEALAKFHLAAAQVNLDFRVSQNVVNRIKLLAGFEKNLAMVSQKWKDTTRSQLNNLRSLYDSLCQIKPSQIVAIANQLHPASTIPVPHQPVIRDVWHDHVLFTGDKVTGLVDFGAMQMDCVSLDLSRLLGSLIGSDDDRFDSAIDDYQKLRRLSDVERQLIRPLDQAAILLSGLNWMNWIVVDERNFLDWSAVDRRLAEVTQRIRDFEI
jgi:homoserine kinase type II